MSNMTSLQKLITTHRIIQQHGNHGNQFSTSSILQRCNWRRPKKPTKPHMRNLEGQALEDHLTKCAASRLERQKYTSAVQEVLQRWRDEAIMKADAESRQVRLTREKEREEAKAMESEIQEQWASVREFIDKHNAQQAAKRADSAVAMEAENAKVLERRQQLEATERERNTEIVVRLIEESKNFLTVDNLDERLDAVLRTETNFNFAITHGGNKIYSTKPPGNLGGWKGASPAAYVDGGIHPNSDVFQNVF